MDATGKTPAQVQCRSCQGTHKYRAPKEAAAAPKAAKVAKTTSPKSAGTKRPSEKGSGAPQTAEALHRRWQGLVSQRAGTAEKPYAVTSAYGPEDVVKHSQFGLGFIVEEVAFNRVKVLFQDAERTLVVRHGQKPPAA
jgi:hypothetical protein